MGVLLWIVAGMAAFGIVRWVGVGRRGWMIELVVAVGAATLFGAIATALDFGGTATVDWRAGLFALAGSLVGIGFLRLLFLARSTEG